MESMPRAVIGADSAKLPNELYPRSDIGFERMQHAIYRAEQTSQSRFFYKAVLGGCISMIDSKSGIPSSVHSRNQHSEARRTTETTVTFAFVFPASLHSGLLSKCVGNHLFCGKGYRL